MSEEWRPRSPEPAEEAGSRPAPLAPKAFKPIPADRPARELGEYLRELVRSTNLKLDRIAQKSELPKSTMSTTMNGTAKGRQSVQDLLDALAAIGRELTTEEQQKVWRLYDVGRRNLAAQQARQRAAAPVLRNVVQPTAQDITVFAHAVVGGMTVTSIELPRRVPGEHLQLTRGSVFRQPHGIEDDGGYRRRINLTRINALTREPRPASPTLPGPRPADAREEIDLEDWIGSLGRAYRRPNHLYAALATPAHSPTEPPAPPAHTASRPALLTLIPGNGSSADPATTSTPVTAPLPDRSAPVATADRPAQLTLVSATTLAPSTPDRADATPLTAAAAEPRSDRPPAVAPAADGWFEPAETRGDQPRRGLRARLRRWIEG